MSADVVDLHCDTVLEIQAGKRRLDQRSTQGHIDLPRLREGGVDVQVFAMYVAPRLAARGPARARELIQAFQEAMAASPKEIAHVTTVEEIEQAQRDGKIAAVLSIENGDALGGDVRALDDFYRLGVRMIGLTWNPSNALGVGGVNFYPGFLGEATLARVLDHIDYMAKVMGIDHVALGSDYDGIPQAPAGLEDVSKLPNLTAGLQARGYTREQIHKILGGNALRVFRQVWKK